MMVQIVRWLFWIVVSCSLLALASIFALYMFLSRSLPEYDGEFTVSGIESPVEIVRDTYDIPHIFGASDQDVFFGLGYAHAQDRLWQMTLMRRTVQGRLSELFGERTLVTDELMRRLGLYQLARKAVADQDPETQAALEAYAKGVNARIREVDTRALGRGAPEFFLFSPEIAPWVPADSIAILKLMGVELSSHFQAEILRAQTLLALDDPSMLEDILPDAPGEAIAELPNYSQLRAPWENSGRPFIRYSDAAPSSHDLMPFADDPDMGGASNAFAAMPGRFANRGTLLANDPHLNLSAPAIWYLARLELQSGGVIGGTIPGLPLILVGRSDRLGWGLTTSYLDNQDLFLEKLNPENPNEYLSPEGFAPFEVANSIIRVKDSDPVTLTLRWTDNGPVLPPDAFRIASITPPGHVISMSWMLLRGPDHSMSAAMEVMRASNVDDVFQAMERFRGPAQMMTVADREQIAMGLVGAMPERHPEHSTKGRLPSQGWIAENQWIGQFPASENPFFRPGKDGLLGNTNNKFIDGEFPNHVSYRWGDTQRIQRWRLLMQRREVHSRESFIEAQLDTVSYPARLIRLIGAELFAPETVEPGSPADRRQRAIQLLGAWKGEMNEHLPEPLIYSAWLRALQQRLISDDLGQLSERFSRANPIFIERVFRNIDGAARWCDVRQSIAEESCADIAALALDDAILWLEERYGGTLESLRWGDEHIAHHDHTVLGEAPLLSYFFNIRQSTSGGDHTLMRGLTKGSGEDPFANVHAGAYRGVYDFSDPDSSVFIISTGQSGHFLSRHYDDLGELWRRGEYIPMSLDPDLARGGAKGIRTLLPE